MERMMLLPLLSLSVVEAPSAIATTTTSPIPPARGTRCSSCRRRGLSSSFIAAPPPWTPHHVLGERAPALALRALAAKVKRKGKSGRSSSRDWSYEHLMVIWDEVFQQCCCDTVKSSRIRDLGVKGLRIHGRGCVFVFQEIQTIPRGSGSGFTSKPPRSSRTVPDFMTLDFSAFYLPREFLLDPLRAPLFEELGEREGKATNHSLDFTETKDEDGADIVGMEMELISDDEGENDAQLLQIIDYNEEDAASVLDDTSYATRHHDDSLLVFSEDDKEEAAVVADTDDSLLIFEKEHSEAVASAQPEIEYFRPVTSLNATVNDSMDDTVPDYPNSKDDEDNRVATEGEHVDLIDREKLFLAMKGMDVTRLLSLTTNFDFEAAKSGRGYKTSIIDMKTMDAGGEDPYNPENGELVLLLHLIIDKRPTFGADVVIAHKHDMPDSIGDDQANSWTLKLKCPIEE